MIRAFATVLLTFFFAAAAQGQRDPGYDSVTVAQSRIDVRDLGHAPVDLIPDGDSGITSLAVAPNDDVYGATSGNRSHLFLFNPRRGTVVPLGVIPGAKAVTHSVVVSEAGDVYMGTTPAGRLLKYTPHESDNQNIEIGKSLPVADLGVAILGESIVALAIDRKMNVIYGLTSPNAHFFKYSILPQKFIDLGVVAKAIPSGEKFEQEEIISRMLVVDADGDVFASGEDGWFYEFDAKKQTLERLAIRTPAIPGREPFTRVDAFLLDPFGLIYGGTSDGYLFRLDPQKLVVANLGKPLNQYRIAGLAAGPSGRLYGAGGDESEMARVFSYDPSTAAYEVLGFVDVNRPPYFTWQAYVIGAIVSDDRGTIYLGENERISKLYLFFP